MKMKLNKKMLEGIFIVILIIVVSTYFSTKDKNEQKRIDENSSYQYSGQNQAAILPIRKSLG